MMHCFACKQTCSSVDDAHCNRGGGGGYFRSLLIANRQDVLRWMFVVNLRVRGKSSQKLKAFAQICKTK